MASDKPNGKHQQRDNPGNEDLTGALAFLLAMLLDQEAEMNVLSTAVMEMRRLDPEQYDELKEKNLQALLARFGKRAEILDNPVLAQAFRRAGKP